LVQTLGSTWDLTDHPSLQHLSKLLKVGVFEQVEEGGDRRSALEVQAQCLVQQLTVPIGECLRIDGTPAATQDPQHHQQQEEP